jgi:hypothetical protein
LIARTLALTGFAASVVLATSPAQAASFNIDFGSYYGTTNNSTFGAAANQPGQWNNITALGTTSGLKDTSNVSTSVSLNLVAGSRDISPAAPSSDLQRLVSDGFFSSAGNNWSVSLTGLDNGAYNVFYYGPSHPNVTTGAFTINGTAVASITGDNTTSFVQGTNYGVLNNVSVSDGTLTLTSTDTTGFRGLSGLQLVGSAPAAVPEPLTILGAVTAAGFGAGFKRKLAKSQENKKDNA